MFARVSDPHRLNADPDHVLHQSDANLRPPSYRPSRPPFWASTALHGFILSLKSSWIFILMWIRIQLFTLMRIRIQLPKTMRIHANPDPKPWLARGTVPTWVLGTKVKASLYLDKVLEATVPGLTLGLWERHHRQRPQVELQAIAYHKTISHLQEKKYRKNCEKTWIYYFFSKV